MREKPTEWMNKIFLLPFFSISPSKQSSFSRWVNKGEDSRLTDSLHYRDCNREKKSFLGRFVRLMATTFRAKENKVIGRRQLCWVKTLWSIYRKLCFLLPFALPYITFLTVPSTDSLYTFRDRLCHMKEALWAHFAFTSIFSPIFADDFKCNARFITRRQF